MHTITVAIIMTIMSIMAKATAAITFNNDHVVDDVDIHSSVT